MFEYETSFFSGTYSLVDVVDALRTKLRLDEVQRSTQLVFVCHSMGGLVVRRLLVQRQIEFIEADKEIGLFLMASVVAPESPDREQLLGLVHGCARVKAGAARPRALRG